MKDKSNSTSLEIMQRNAAKAEAMLKLLANAKRLMILYHLVKSEQSVGKLAELINLLQGITKKLNYILDYSKIKRDDYDHGIH
jgi:DNA-binding transcriptional ArsR family regulator